MIPSSLFELNYIVRMIAIQHNPQRAIARPANNISALGHNNGYGQIFLGKLAIRFHHAFVNRIELAINVAYFILEIK
jgi:hypothetical protein